MIDPPETARSRSENWLYNNPAGNGWWPRKGQVRPFSTSSLKRLEAVPREKTFFANAILTKHC